MKKKEKNVKAEKSKRSALKKTLKIIVIVICAVALLAAGYVAYVLLSYHRIGDVPLDVEQGAQANSVCAGETYTVTTYNVGFGAYQQDFTCVMDHCYVKEDGQWKWISGKNLKAFSEEDALRNTNGAAKTIADLDPDFALFQEADLDSDRCRHVNQIETFKNALPEMSSVYCSNFHTPFFCYPVNDMMGKAESGLLTFSSVNIQKADRYEFAVTDNIIDRNFDLDRCFSVSYIDVDNGRQLVLINLHMSAYDEGGVIRAEQRKTLYGFMENEMKKGNYIIAGGDFNHDLLTYNPDYPQYTKDALPFVTEKTQKIPEDPVFFFDEDSDAGLPDGLRLVAADNCPTCRPAAITWQPEFCYCHVLDGFIVSDNVEVTEIRNIVTSTDKLDGFAYSDHEPVMMEFSLK